MLAANASFIETFGLGMGGVVCIVGAGGKTSLLMHLAGEGRSLGYRTLVSTTTKIMIPDRVQVDALDLSGHGFVGAQKQAGIYVAGKQLSSNKMMGLAEDILWQNTRGGDLTLLEADGAATKSLKGWLQSEPVIPHFTTHTIGVIDIQAVGQKVADDLVHRLDCFCRITGAQEGESVTVEHLQNMVTHDQGLFFHGTGKLLVYINKVESTEDKYYAKELQASLPEYSVFMGSLKMQVIFANSENM
ncbi:MAG: putative selenium-dependent hydroxylase accessory protein YqeC [Desulfotalea sp.]|nr:MAG: putative selenium-dependent hydroxylase accessory protein YqeC [Desulfotalea sp.]